MSMTPGKAAENILSSCFYLIYFLRIRFFHSFCRPAAFWIAIESIVPMRRQDRAKTVNFRASCHFETERRKLFLDFLPPSSEGAEFVGCRNDGRGHRSGRLTSGSARMSCEYLCLLTKPSTKLPGREAGVVNSHQRKMPVRPAQDVWKRSEQQPFFQKWSKQGWR